MSIPVATSLDYLIPELRLHLGDIVPSAYRYTDEWLRTALVASVKDLQRWWKSRYTVNTSTYVVSRSPDHDFEFSSPPVVQTKDEKPIILMASIIIKGGSLEANSWNVGSWRDAEFSVSNIEGNKAKESSYAADWKALTDLIKPPTKQLTAGGRQSMYGAEESNE